MGKIYESLRNQFSFELDYRKGNLFETITKANPSYINTTTWIQTSLGWGVNCFGSRGYIAYDIPANLSSGSMSIILLGNFTMTNNNYPRYIESAPGAWATTNWSLTGMNNLNQLTGIVNDKTSTMHSLLFDVVLNKNKLIALTHRDNTAPLLYVDGKFVDESNTVVPSIRTSVANTKLSIGSYYNLSNRAAFQWMNLAVGINKQLSSSEIADLYAELLSECYSTKSYFFQNETITKQIGTPVLHWDLKERDATGQFPDLSGNGRSSTTAKVTSTPSGVKPTTGSLPGLTLSNFFASAPAGASHQVSFTCKMSSASTAQIFIGHNGAAYYLYSNSPAYLRWNIGGATNNQDYVWAPVNDRTYQFTLDRAGSDVYVNGKKLQKIASPGFGAAPVAGDLHVGFYTAGTVFPTLGSLRDFRWYTTAQDVRKLYLEGSRVIADIDLTFAPETFTPISTVNSEIIKGSELRLVSGTASIVSIPTKAIANGFTASMPIDTVGGSIRCTLNRGDGETFIGWSSVKGGPTATGQNGYWLRATSGQSFSLRKSVAGVESAIGAGTTLAAGEFEIQLNWEFDGTITWWYRIPGSKQWILGSTVVDTAVTSTSYLTIIQGGIFSRFINRITVNEIALTPEEWTI